MAPLPSRGRELVVRSGVAVIGRNDPTLLAASISPAAVAGAAAEEHLLLSGELDDDFRTSSPKADLLGMARVGPPESTKISLWRAWLGASACTRNRSS